MKRIYVAGPYTGPDVMTILQNMRRGMQICINVIKAGFSPICPWLDYQYVLLDGSIIVEQLQAISIAQLEGADAVLVLPNSQNSIGTQKEIKLAKKLSIPIIFLTETYISALNPDHLARHIRGILKND